MNHQVKNDPWNILLLIGSILALLISFSGAAGTFLLGVAGLFVGGSVSGGSAWVLLGTFVGLALVSLPSGWVAFQALQGRALAIPRPSLRPIRWLLIIFPIILLLGTVAFQGNFLPSILGPPAHMLAALIPVIALVFIVLLKAPTISQRRGWAHFMVGLWISPISALILEILAALPLILIVVVGLNASLGQDFFLGLLDNPDIFPDETSLEKIVEVVSQPGYLLLFLGYLGIFVPIIEELIKAIGILPLLRRQITEAEGFLGGVLAGAGYGFFEALFLGQPGPGWAALMVARGGATMMHMLTTGLTGIGIARAKNSTSFKPFMGKYLTAVALHALWNLAAVVMGIGMASEALTSANLTPLLGNAMAIGGGAVLVALSILAFQSLRKLSPEPERPNESVDSD